MDIDNFILAANSIETTGKVVLLVDELTTNKMFGATKSIAKIIRNLQTIGSDFFKEVEERLLKTNNGITFVWQLGRYINATQISNDKREGLMMFFGFKKGDVELKQQIINLLKEQWSENTSNGFEKIYMLMEKNYSSEDDVVELTVAGAELN